MRVWDRICPQSLREEESKTRALRATNTELMARLEQLERTGQALGGGTGGADVRDLIESNRRLRQELTVKNQQAEVCAPRRPAPPPVTALPPRRARPAWLPAGPSPGCHFTN